MAQAAKGFGYDRVAAGIIRMIGAEGYVVDQKLPKLEDLQDRFGASSTTTRKAVDILKDRGILESRQGSGLFVKRLPEAEETDTTTGADDEVRDALNDLRHQVRTLSERIDRLEMTRPTPGPPRARPSHPTPRRSPKSQP